MIPFWAKDEEIGNRMINARAETVKEKPSFRNALKRKRCLVLADFFYEWQKIPGSTRKQPVCIHLRDQEPFVFAGLWDTWKKPDETEIESYTGVTQMTRKRRTNRSVAVDAVPWRLEVDVPVLKA